MKDIWLSKLNLDVDRPENIGVTIFWELRIYFAYLFVFGIIFGV